MAEQRLKLLKYQWWMLHFLKGPNLLGQYHQPGNTSAQRPLCLLCVFHHTEGVFPHIILLTALRLTAQRDLCAVYKHWGRTEEYMKHCWKVDFYSVNLGKRLKRQNMSCDCLYFRYLTAICDWHECAISQHMTQTLEPPLTGEEGKKKNTRQLL